MRSAPPRTKNDGSNARLVPAYQAFTVLVLALYLVCVWDCAHSRRRLAKLIIASRSAVAGHLGADGAAAQAAESRVRKSCDDLFR